VYNESVNLTAETGKTGIQPPMNKREILDTVFTTMRMRKNMMQVKLSELISANGGVQSRDMHRVNLKLVLLMALDDIRQMPVATWESIGESSPAVQAELCQGFNRQFPEAEANKEKDLQYLTQACQVLAVNLPPGATQGLLDPATMPKTSPELS
jgi:hypothetical protein